MQKRILITRFPYEAVFSGEEIHTLLLAEKLREKCFEIEFAGSCPVLLPEFAKRDFVSMRFWGGKALVSTKSFWIFCLTFPFVILSFLHLACNARFKYKTDVAYLLSLNEKLFLTPWLVLFGIKIIWVEHSRIGDWLGRNPFLFLYRFWSKFAKIISVSKLTQKQLIELGVPEKNVHFILNGVDVEELEKVGSEELGDWREKNGEGRMEKGEGRREKVEGRKKYIDSRSESGMTRKIGLITRLYHDKGLDYFLGALRVLIQKYPEIQVYIVGEGPHAKEFRFFAKDLPVHFLGKMEHNEIKYFLHSIDFFILPSSVHDPFGLAAAEAMVCGKPVIVTDVCGISDFLRNEKNGLIIPAKDTQAIVSAFEKLFQDKTFADLLSQEGQKLAKEKFGLERMVSEYEKIISNY